MTPDHEQPHVEQFPERARAGGASIASAERDSELIAAIRAGGGANPATRDAWGELLTRHHDRLMSVCYRVLGDRAAATDMVQDVCVKILQSLDSYDGRSQFATWITRIAINRCYTHLRSEKLRRHASLDRPGLAGQSQDIAEAGFREDDGKIASGGGVGGRGHSGELSPDEGVETAEARRIVSAALTELSPEQRAILVLRDVQDLDYEQIAAVLELELGTVKSRLFRARAALREAVERLSDG